MPIETVLRTRERIAKIVRQVEAIATLPEVTARIISTVNDPHSTAADLHQILSHDPALVTRLLKLVNSAFYGRTSKIDSVQRAIVLLGFDAVHHLAIAATMGQLFRGVKLCEGFTARDLWTHCIAVGVAARELARHTHDTIAEETFLAGLVHDVGLLVSLQVCPDQLRQVCQLSKEPGANFSALEQDIIGVDHEELGAALAESWGFPLTCQVIAGHHHHPSMAESEWRHIAALVYAADSLCCEQGIGFNLTALNQVPDEPAFRGVVPLSAIEVVRGDLKGLVSSALAVLG